ncbi:MAG: hypothetical protein AB7K68_17350 [Bacteriovoracia bacterium]
MVGKARLFLLLFFVPLLVHAEDDCYRDFLVVDKTVLWDFDKSPKTNIALPSWNGSSPPFYTKATGHFSLQDGNLRALFDFNSDLLSLPYNVYRLDLIVGGEEDGDRFVSSRDFTNGCTRSGLSFYPRSVVELPAVKVPDSATGENRGLRRVRIRIWGVLR